MRRITFWLLSTVAALVMLFSYRTSTMGTGGGTNLTSANAAGGTSGTGSSGSGAAPSSSAGSQNGTSSGSSSNGAKTYDGSVEQTRWGPVQVRITVVTGKIADIEAVVYPNDNHRDQEINGYALPVLHDEVIAAQSANIDTVSGATVTSDGYIASLQSAIDAAHLS